MKPESTFYIISQVSIFNSHLTCLVFLTFLNELDITDVSESSKCQIAALNVMVIRDQRHAMSVNKQHYWMALTLVSPSGAYVGVALIDPFMKV